MQNRLYSGIRYLFQAMSGKELRYKNCRKVLLSLLFLIITVLLAGQAVHDTLSSSFTLPQCITFALTNQSLIKQSLIDEDITKKDIRIALSGWYPQLEADANVQHFLKAPIAYYPDMNNPPSYTP